MTSLYIEEIFKVTETLQNGKERRVTKSVYCDPFKIDASGKEILRSDTERIAEAKRALYLRFYYEIEHIKTKETFLIMA